MSRPSTDRGAIRLPRARAPLAALVVAAALAVLGWSRPAAAYAWMIRHDYGGCNACHADPSGGGLLTQYGRMQGEILLRTHYKSGSEEEDPGKVGDFLFGAIPLPETLLLGGDARGLAYYSKPQGFDGTTDLFLMQADLQGQVAFDRLRFNGSIGYASKGALPASVTHGTDDRLVSRVYWAGADLGADNQFLLRAGRMNLPFGIRSIEHTMWVRSQTRTDINAAQQHGVAFAYNGEKLRGELMAFLGNFQVHPDEVRERGYAGYLEYLAIDRLALGLSSLVGHTNTDLALRTPLWRHAHGLFARYSPAPVITFLAESDLLLTSQPEKNSFGNASSLQADLEPIQGVHLIGTGELLDASFSETPPSYRLWGSLAWFCLPHADVRFDALWQSVAGTTERANANVFLAQFHAYL
jgi:hypothetical protein